MLSTSRLSLISPRRRRRKTTRETLAFAVQVTLFGFLVNYFVPQTRGIRTLTTPLFSPTITITTWAAFAKKPITIATTTNCIDSLIHIRKQRFGGSSISFPSSFFVKAASTTIDSLVSGSRVRKRQQRLYSHHYHLPSLSLPSDIRQRRKVGGCAFCFLPGPSVLLGFDNKVDNCQQFSSAKEAGRLDHHKNTATTTRRRMTILDSPSAERNKGPIWDVLSSQVLPVLGSSSDSSSTSGSNRDPIRVLEIAAGCGVHTLFFVSEMMKQHNHKSEVEQKDEEQQKPNPIVSWYPTDPDDSSRASISARILAQAESKVKKCIQEPFSLTLDANGGKITFDHLTGQGKQVETSSRDAIVGLLTLLQSDATKSGVSSSSTTTTTMTTKESPQNKMDLVICINMIHISPWDATVGLMKVASAVLRSGGILYCYGPYKVAGTAVESNLNFDKSLKSRNPSWGVRNLEDVIEAAQEHGLQFAKTVAMPANNLSVIFTRL